MKITEAIQKSGTARTLEHFRKQQTGEYLGAPVYTYGQIGTIYASVQPATSDGEVDRLIIEDTEGGSKINRVYQCYSEIMDIENQDLVKLDGVWYEVRPVKDYVNTVMLSHMKFYITEKDSQDV